MVAANQLSEGRGVILGKRRHAGQSVPSEGDDSEEVKLVSAKKPRNTETEVRNSVGTETVQSVAVVYGKPKVLTCRAFHDDLIDRLPDVVETETLVHSANLLDASVRIYSSRVDNTFIQVFEVKRQLGKETPEQPSDDHNIKYNSEDEYRFITQGSNTSFEAVSQKTLIESKESPKEFNVQTTYEGLSNIKDDCAVSLPSISNLFLAGILNVEYFMENFKRSMTNVSAKNSKRREKVPQLDDCLENLNAPYSDTSKLNAIYEKAARNFTEGSCRGLLLVNAVTNLNAAVIVLHNYDDLIIDDIYNNTDEAELFGVYESLLDAEKPHSRQLYKDGKNLYLMEHDFCMSTQHLLLNDRNNNTAAAVDLLLLDQFETPFQSLILFKWRKDFENKYSLSTRQFFKLTTAILCKTKVSIWRWLARRLFTKSDLVMESNEVDEKNTLDNTSTPDILKCSEKSMLWIPHFKRVANKNLASKDYLYLFFYAEDQGIKKKDVDQSPLVVSSYFGSLIAPTIFTKNDFDLLVSITSKSRIRQIISKYEKWRKGLNNDIQVHNLSDSKASITKVAATPENSQFVVENMEGNDNFSGCNVCDNVIDSSHWQAQLRDELKKKPLSRTMNTLENHYQQPVLSRRRVTIANYTPLTTRDLNKSMGSLPSDKDPGSCSGQISNVDCGYDETVVDTKCQCLRSEIADSEFCNLELSLYHGDESMEEPVPEVEKLFIDDSEGIFARAFGLTHITQQRSINTSMIKNAIKVALSSKEWLMDLPEKSFNESFCVEDGVSDTVALSSLLGRIRFEMMGSMNEFAVTDVFSVLLHVCNENNLELVQLRDSHGMVKEQGLGEIFISRRIRRLARK